MKKIKKILSNVQKGIDFRDIDRQLLQGFECSQFNNDKRKFLSMIKEQTNSAIDNKKYWNFNQKFKFYLSQIIRFVVNDSLKIH